MLHLSGTPGELTLLSGASRVAGMLVWWMLTSCGSTGPAKDASATEVGIDGLSEVGGDGISERQDDVGVDGSIEACRPTAPINPVCPTAVPLGNAGVCVAGAICSYRYTCAQGCQDSFAFCSKAGDDWQSSIGGCGPCSQASSPGLWETTHSLTFAETTGNCPGLDTVTYDPRTGAFGSAFTCVDQTRRADYCVVDDTLQCSDAPLTDTLTINLHLTLDRTGSWVGTATVQSSLSTGNCTGTYNVFAPE